MELGGDGCTVYQYSQNNVSQLSKSSKGSESLFLFKGDWSLLIKKLPIKVTLKSLLLLVCKNHKFENNDYKLQKGYLNLKVLLQCKKSNLIPKFLQFKSSNRHLHNFLVCKKCHIKLLEEEIRAKQKKITSCKRTQRELEWSSCLEFSCICHFFLEISLNEVINGIHVPKEVISNFYLYKLNDVERSVLCKDLNLSIK